MNRTSTQGSGWKWDCEYFAKQKEPFKLENVSSPEHEAFCNTLSTIYNLKAHKEENIVTFTPGFSS